MTLYELDLKIKQLDLEIAARERQMDRKRASLNKLLEDRMKLISLKKQAGVAHVA